MAHVAIAQTLDLHQHRVVVAIHEDLLNRELVARRLPLHPERLPRAAVKSRESARLGLRQRHVVHEADHQHLTTFGILNDRGHESVELCVIHYESLVSLTPRPVPRPSTSLRTP